MKLVRFFNRQRSLPFERTLWRRVARCLLEELLNHDDYELGVHLIGAAEMARLNETFLGHEGSTDVITFNHKAGRSDRSDESDTSDHPLHGEIFISMDDALAYARRFRVPWAAELARYLIHGVLHLEGFDDTEPASRRTMKRRENKLLKELSARFNLGKIKKRSR